MVSGPWLSQNVHIQVMRGGSLTIPDWFADTYLDGRKLGVGFGGGWSGWASCSAGAGPGGGAPSRSHGYGAGYHPLLQYDQDNLAIGPHATPVTGGGRVQLYRLPLAGW